MTAVRRERVARAEQRRRGEAGGGQREQAAVVARVRIGTSVPANAPIVGATHGTLTAQQPPGTTEDEQ
jgi:hypothetical protein